MSKVGLCGKSGREGHFEVALESKEGGHEEEQFRKGPVHRPVLDHFEQNSRGNISEARDQERDENLTMAAINTLSELIFEHYLIE